MKCAYVKSKVGSTSHAYNLSHLILQTTYAYTDTIFRPPGNDSFRRKLMFYCSLFFSPRNLRAFRSKHLGALPPGKIGAKTYKILRYSGRLQTSVANISGMDKDIQSQTSKWFTTIPPAFGKTNPTLAH